MQLLVSAFQELFYILKKKVRRSRGRCRDLMSKELLMGFYFWRDTLQGLAHPKFKELWDKVSTLIWFSIFRAGEGRLRSETPSLHVFLRYWLLLWRSTAAVKSWPSQSLFFSPFRSVLENLWCVAGNCQTVIDEFSRRTWNAPRVRAGCGMFLH